MKIAQAKPLTHISEPHSYRFPLLKAKKVMMEEGKVSCESLLCRKDNGDRMREPHAPRAHSEHHGQG